MSHGGHGEVKPHTKDGADRRSSVSHILNRRGSNLNAFRASVFPAGANATVVDSVNKRKSVNILNVSEAEKAKPQSEVFTYLDTENQTTFTSTNPFLDKKRFLQVDSNGYVKEQDTEFEVGEFVHMAEKPVFKQLQEQVADIDTLGYLYRVIAKYYILATHDEVNALRITRTLQFHLFVQTGYEGYLLDELLVAFTNRQPGYKKNLRGVLKRALRNRNISRIVIRTVRTTWDYWYHIDNLYRYGKYLDSFQQTFFFTGFGFPASENFVNTRDLTVSVFFRAIFGEGSFITRTFAGRQALQTDNEDVIAQNLAAEVTGFETANRNQYGTYLGRLKTNEFRKQHRLPVDESLVRSFQTLTLSTTINNGVEACLLQLARHWHNMLYQVDGNFAHQRMEQLNPFQFLRFQLPSFLVAMTTLRGICSWDSEILAPYVSRLQLIKPGSEMVPYTKKLIQELRDNIVIGVCGGIASRVDPFLSLVDAMDMATDLMTAEALRLNEFLQENKIDFILSNVRFVLNKVDWPLPSPDTLRNAIVAICKDKNHTGVCAHAARRALNLLAPKDKRTLYELCAQGYENSHAAFLLITRTVTLLQREISRDRLDQKLIEISKGGKATVLHPKSAYWIMESNGRADVFIYDGTQEGNYRFHNRATRDLRFISSLDSVEIRVYVDVAELITLAQWIFMKIELDFGKKFTYSGFMEYHYMRDQLRFLIVVSQLQSYVLDDARFNRLQSIQNANLTVANFSQLQPGETYYYYKNKQYQEFKCPEDFDDKDPKYDFLKKVRIVTIPPQSMIMIGGGPTGLLGTLHCLENVLLTSGTMTLFESRDAFALGGATFERAQIVRLDSRWIAMLRYHLGTIYEDVFVPATGETDSHYGNQLPFQGFIEITIKDMENMMNVRVAQAASRGLLKHFTNSSAQYNYDNNRLIKRGKDLVIGDLILRKIDSNGKASDFEHTWKITELTQIQPLNPSDLVLNKKYVLYPKFAGKGRVYIFFGVDTLTGTYSFQLDNDEDDILVVSDKNLPSIYPEGTKLDSLTKTIVAESFLRGDDGTHIIENFDYYKFEKERFIMDVGESHVCTAIGKAHSYEHHIEFTTEEPYGVCCLFGLKVSMTMHNFGTRRFRQGIVDDVRSGIFNDQNTRVVGDFTKIVNAKLISKNMVSLLEKDPNFKIHFFKIAENLGFETNESYWSLLTALVGIYRRQAPYKRSHLQTRFFETGDNFYLGMEFTREYDTWKKGAVSSLVDILVEFNNVDKMAEAKQVSDLYGTIAHNIDRLWYQAALDTIKQGDVYNPGGRDQVPHLRMLDSYTPSNLSDLEVAESFRLVSDPTRRYEVLFKTGIFGGNFIVCRDHEGFVSRLEPSTLVYLGGNLTRGPDGAAESKVSIATFPVGHLVNYRSMRLSNSTKGYAVAFFGDEQSSPHFMRYSGLTGAAINVMLFDNYIGNVIDKVPFVKCFGSYAASTNWSNGEVVQRGTNTNYGEDAFLRPGFPYIDGIKYLYAKVIEHIESEQDMEWVLSRDWKIKFAAALIPRGLEGNIEFLYALVSKFEDVLFDHALTLVPEYSSSLKERKKHLATGPAITLSDHVVARTLFEAKTLYWENFFEGLSLDHITKERLLSRPGVFYIVRYIELTLYSVIEMAQLLKSINQRVSSQTLNQPPSLDAFIDDFAVEAQPTTNILVQASTYAALSLAVRFRSTAVAALFSAIFWWFSIGTISNTSRYKNRNEEWRVIFFDEKYVKVMRGVFACMNKSDRAEVPNEINPYIRILEQKKDIFVKNCSYYNMPKPKEFLKLYRRMLAKIQDPIAIETFMKSIVTHFIPDIYHVNSYIQENLVDVYAACNEIYRLETARHPPMNAGVYSDSKRLFFQMVSFEPRLNSSLSRGRIIFGAFKQYSLKHQHIAITILYFRTILWFILPSFKKKLAVDTSVKPVAGETWEIIRRMRKIVERLPKVRQTELQRELVDTESLYYATMESYASSFVVISGFISFFIATGFIIANIGINVQPDNPTWQHYAFVSTVATGAVSPVTSVAAAWYLFRQLSVLLPCIAAVKRKQLEVSDNATASGNLGKCLVIMRSTAVVTLFRALASLAAAVGLPFALYAMIHHDVNEVDALWLAVSSVGTQLLANVILFYIEYNQLYNLPPQLGEFIGVAFGGELNALKDVFSIPKNDIENDIVQERVSWEYVARAFLHQYRFDTAFGANRFGSIFQYIQSGLSLRPQNYAVIRAQSPDVNLFDFQTKKKNFLSKRYGFADQPEPVIKPKSEIQEVDAPGNMQMTVIEKSGPAESVVESKDLALNDVYEDKTKDNSDTVSPLHG